MQAFNYLGVGIQGEVTLCCPGWVDKRIGQILPFDSRENPIKEIWHSEAAEDFRNTIRNQTYTYCNEKCPYLKSKSVVFNNTIPDVPDVPKVINLAYDKACNLACPSCRPEPIRKPDYWAEGFRKQIEKLGYAPSLYFSGSADPFGNTHYFNWLRDIDDGNSLQVGEFVIHTNGILLDRLLRLPNVLRKVSTLRVSLDAGTSETYLKVRKSDSFDRIIRNIKMVQKAHSTRLELNMVVQSMNFHEMKEMYNLGVSLGADVINFDRIQDWYDRPDHVAHDVANPTHQMHDDFKRHLTVLREVTACSDKASIGL